MLCMLSVLLFAGHTLSVCDTVWRDRISVNNWLELSTSAPGDGSLATAGEFQTAVLYGSKLVVFGGGIGNPSESVWTFDIDTCGWGSVVPDGEMVVASGEHVAMIRENYMVVTGLAAVRDVVSGIGVRTFQLNLETGVWIRLAYPFETGMSLTLPHDATSSFLMFGRLTEDFVPNDNVFRYDHDVHVSDTGNPFVRIAHADGVPWPERRYAHASCLRDGVIWTFGGINFDSSVDRTLWKYDTNTKVFSYVFNAASDLPDARFGHQMLCVVGGLILIGGSGDFNKTDLFYNDVWRFDIASKTWTEIFPPTSPPARVGLTCAAESLYIFCYGGMSDVSYYNDVWVFQHTTRGPTITELVASDPDNLDDTFNNGDVLRLRFNVPTNQPAVDTPAAVNALFAPSVLGIGSAIGVWISASLLELTVVNAAGYTGSNAPVLGAFTATIGPEGGLRVASGNSLLAETTSPPLTGNWGKPPGPRVVAFRVSDPDNLDGVYGNGDVLTLEFDKATNQPVVATKADVLDQFDFSSSIGTDFTGAWTSPSVLRITIMNAAAASVAIGDLVVQPIGTLQNAALTSEYSTQPSPVLTGSFGTKPGPNIIQFIAADPDNSDGVFSTGDTLTVVFDEATDQPFAASKLAVDNLLSFTTGLGADYAGVWVSNVSLVVTIADADGAVPPPAVGSLGVSVIGELRDALSKTLPSNSSFSPLAGNWGTKEGPSIEKIVANDPDDLDAVFSDGDTVSVHFTANTNTPPATTKVLIDGLMTFSSSLGTSYTGAWRNSTLVLDISIHRAAVVDTPVVGSTTCTLRGSITDAARTLVPSRQTSLPMVGDWGLLPGPRIIGFTAFDVDNLDALFSANDTIVILFNGNTNTPPVHTKAHVDALFSFTISLGAGYHGEWSTNSRVVITIDDATGAGGDALPTIGDGRLNVTVIGPLRNIGLTSLVSTSSAGPIQGSFGNRRGPSISSFVASDPDNLDGYYSNGDLITLTFTEPTNAPPVGSRTELAAFLSFTNTAGAPVNLGVEYAGAWVSEDVLEITVGNPAGSTPPAIGSLKVEITGTLLKNAASTSLPSSGRYANAITGDWGVGPLCDHTTCDVCSPSSGCGWCSSSASCRVGDLDAPFWGTCDAWYFESCPVCNSSSCSACLGPECGWCATAVSQECLPGTTTGPHFGACSGSWRGSADSCPTAITTPVTSNTSESGERAYFNVSLSSQPVEGVLITLATSDDTEGSAVAVSGLESLSFSVATWDLPQLVTVIPVDDNVADGDVPYSINLVTWSADLTFKDMHVPPVALYNVDNDVAAIVLEFTAAINTTEAGRGVSLAVSIATRPIHQVNVSVTSSDSTEALVLQDGPDNPAHIVFTPANWNLPPRLVRVEGVDDFLVDGPQRFVVQAVGTSSDVAYNNLRAESAAVYNLDDDVAGLVVSSPSGPTSEDGRTATIRVALQSKPTSAVTVPVASYNPAEGTIVGAFPLFFSPAAWNVQQTITVKGEDDFYADGPQAYNISVGNGILSTDPMYDGRFETIRTLINEDNDVASIVVSAVNGFTQENGLRDATFTIRLSSMPRAPVIITMFSDDPTEGVLSRVSVTFNAATYSIAILVTVSGVDDIVTDGDVTYHIVFDPAVSADSTYNGMVASPVAIINVDNDQPGIFADPLAGLTTSENLETDEVKVKLFTRPLGVVSLPLFVNDSTEVAVSPAALTFTDTDWMVFQTVTVRGVDDAVVDGPVPFALILGPTSSDDERYNGTVATREGLNADNDVATISIVPVGSAVTRENGTTVTLALALTAMPAAPVNVTVNSTNSNEGSLNVTMLTFAPVEWNVPQALVVTGVDDFYDDGDVVYEITATSASEDALFDGLSKSIELLNEDDGDRSALLFPSLPSNSSTTTEAGLSSSFTVQLASMPFTTVSVDLTSSNVDEGVVSPAFLTFPPARWNIPQTVTVTGQNDDVDDGDMPYDVEVGPVASDDALYFALPVVTLAFVNMDDGDTAGLAVSSPSGPTTEEGGSATFTVALTSQPLHPVVVPAVTLNTLEGVAAPASLSFAVSSWAVPQTITVTGVDDDVADDDILYYIQLGPSTSDDPGYDLPAVSVGLVNINDDEAKIVVSAPITPLQEGPGSPYQTVAIEVYLSSRPRQFVEIPFALSSTEHARIRSPLGLNFTRDDFNTPQMVEIESVSNWIDDGAKDVQLMYGPARSPDAQYNLAVGEVALLVLDDDDTAGFVVTGISDVSEGGTAALVSVALASEPVARVDVPVSMFGALDEFTIFPTSLSFPRAAWNVSQLLTLRGQDDLLSDGAQCALLVVGGARSSDPLYNTLFAGPFAICNQDDDPPGIIVTAPEILSTSESGGSDSIMLSLASRPIAAVTISVTSSNVNEGVVTPSSVTILPDQWNTTHVLTVVGVQDSVVDQLVHYEIAILPAVSDDAAYDALPAQRLTVPAVNRDDDGGLVQFSPPAPAATTEGGGTVSFLLALTTFPGGTVALRVTSSDVTEGMVTSASGPVRRAAVEEVTLVFQATTWQQPQRVVVVGQDDVVDEGGAGVPYTIDIDILPSTLGPGLSVPMTNLDDGLEKAGLTVVAPATRTTTENGDSVFFTVALASQPRAAVTLPVSTDASEAAVLPGALSFAAGSWNTPQTVTVTGVADNVADGTVAYDVTLGAATSEDELYHGITETVGGFSNVDTTIVIPPATPPPPPVVVSVVTIDSIAPQLAPLGVSTTFIITGSGFGKQAVVFLGGTRAGNISLFDATTLIFEGGPVHSVGYRTVVVVNADGGSATRAAGVYFSNDCPYYGFLGVGEDCFPCPVGGVCPGGNRIYPEKGFFLNGRTLLQCSPPDRCVGGMDSDAQCGVGYTGELCGACAAGYTSFHGSCAACPSGLGLGTSWFVLVAFWLSFIFLCCVVEEHIHSHIVWAIVLLSFIRAVGAASHGGVPYFVRRFYTIIGFLSLDISFVHIGCGATAPDHVTVFFGNLLAVVTVLLLLVAFTLTMWKWDVNGRGEYYAHRFFRAVSSFAFITYWIVCFRVLQGIACLEFPTDDGKELRLLAEVAQKCYSGRHYAVGVFSWPILIIYAVGLPVCIAFVYKMYEDDLDRASVRSKFGFFYEILEIEGLYFSLFIFGLLFMLALGAAVFPHSPTVQFITMEVAVMAFLLFIVSKQPFSLLWQDIMAACVGVVSLLGCVLNFTSHRVFAEGVVGSGWLVFQAYVVVILTFLVILVYIALLLKHIRSDESGDWSLAARILYARGEHGDDARVDEDAYSVPAFTTLSTLPDRKGRAGAVAPEIQSPKSDGRPGEEGASPALTPHRLDRSALPAGGGLPLATTAFGPSSVRNPRVQAPPATMDGSTRGHLPPIASRRTPATSSDSVPMRDEDLLDSEETSTYTAAIHTSESDNYSEQETSTSTGAGEGAPRKAASSKDALSVLRTQASLVTAKRMLRERRLDPERAAAMMSTELRDKGKSAALGDKGKSAALGEEGPRSAKN